MSSTRQEKVANLLQEELAKIFQKQSKNLLKNIIISVSEIRITSDLSIAKVYLSIFPTDHQDAIFKEILEMKSSYRNQLGKIVKNQLRIVPDLIFYLDTTFDKMDAITKELNGESENPLL